MCSLPQLPLGVDPAQRLSYSGVLVACPSVSLVLLRTEQVKDAHSQSLERTSHSLTPSQ